MSDIALTIGSTTKHFDLAVQDKAKMLAITEEPIIPIRSLADVPSYGDLPPDKILAFVQNNWRGGMGQKNHFNIMDMFADGQNINTRNPNEIKLGPLIVTAGGIAATILYLYLWGDEEYAASSSKVYRWNGTTAWVEVLDTGGVIKAITSYDEYIIVAVEDSDYFVSTSGDSASWSNPGLSNQDADQLVVAPSFTATKDILVKGEESNEIRTAIDPFTGAWTDPPTYVGDEGSNLTGLFVLNGTLFIGKTDGLYALPPDGRPVLVISFKEQKNTTNFKYHTNWQGIEYVSANDDILELLSTSGITMRVDYMGPLGLSPELEVTGTIKGIANDGKNLYAIFLIGSNYIIYAGRERFDVKYGLRWEWIPFVHLGTNVCAALKVMQRSGAGAKLWFAYGTNMAYVSLPEDSTHRYATQGYLTTTYFTAGYDTWQKIFYQLWSIAKNLTATINIKVYYMKDTQTSWTLLTTIVTSGVKSVNLAGLSCKKIRLKLELNTDDATKSPVLQQFIYRGILQPEQTRTLDITVILAQSDSRKPSSDLSFLEGGRTATAPITLKDLRFGTTKYIMYLPNSPTEIEVIDDVSNQPSYRARIQAQVLNWTSP
ncbi:hypothetical protein LCGC14_1128140 [marine sediment metagenome]|uniref:Uncharacterized protein n=1 Tax=marine sediment metagenome TaxID=412755 RepID=A0A0F9M216_9ZZZZ